MMFISIWVGWLWLVISIGLVCVVCLVWLMLWLNLWLLRSFMVWKCIYVFVRL